MVRTSFVIAGFCTWLGSNNETVIPLFSAILNICDKIEACFVKAEKKQRKYNNIHITCKLDSFA